MTNILIAVEGDTAVSETYMTASLRAQPTENSASTSVVRGRYADRWSKRNGRWAIDHRLYTLDFHDGDRVDRVEPVGPEPPRPDGPVIFRCIRIKTLPSFETGCRSSPAPPSARTPSPPRSAKAE